MDIVRYQVSKTNGGPAYHEWTGVEFVGRVAALIPPARKHVVRYYGALGPRSPLRGALTAATKAKATSEELEAGCSVTVAGKISREARRAASKALRAWAFPKTKASRAPPDRGEASGEGSQANARGEADEGRQDFPSEDPA